MPDIHRIFRVCREGCDRTAAEGGIGCHKPDGVRLLKADVQHCTAIALFERDACGDRFGIAARRELTSDLRERKFQGLIGSPIRVAGVGDDDVIQVRHPSGKLIVSVHRGSPVAVRIAAGRYLRILHVVPMRRIYPDLTLI